jgi:hypothetical protein
MKKALEILRDIQDSKWCGVKPTLVLWKLKDFDEAIKELEDLQNRSCDNCRYDYCGCSIQDSILKIEPDANFDNFSCNKWESKDE